MASSKLYPDVTLKHHGMIKGIPVSIIGVDTEYFNTIH